MKLEIVRTSVSEIVPLRALFLEENNFQIRYNALHERGRTDSYSIRLDDAPVGYASVFGRDNSSDRDTVFEFYLIPSKRHLASTAFKQLLCDSSISFIASQTNCVLLTSLLYEFGTNINASAILFGDFTTTSLAANDVVFRATRPDDVVFEHTSEPVGDYVLVKDQQIVASGGFLLHYNVPFADLYMEVREDCRRQGLGSFLLQEVKKQCYLAGRVPAARCNIENTASKATLLKAGFSVAGYLLSASKK